MSITTLEGLANGTDLAVQSGGQVFRWTYQDEVMVNQAGNRVDPWFFSGYLREGHVSLGDFRPPELGEWFTTDTRTFLVVSVSRDHPNDPVTARFMGSTFSRFLMMDRIVENARRCESPAWANDTLVQMTIKAWKAEEEVTSVRQRLTHMRRARDYLGYAMDHLEENS